MRVPRGIRIFVYVWRCLTIAKLEHQINEEIRDKEIRVVGTNGEQLGIMGVALFAKNAFVQEKFRRMLEAGELHKTYLAAVFGCPAAPSGTIDLPVWKPPGGTLVREVDARGQRAVTDYRVLEASGGTALLELSPRTGRTHQLRLHCLASGWPILGDPQYATPASRAFSDRAGLYTQQLAAVRLAFSHPATGAPLVLRSRLGVKRPDSTDG